ncbi:MAG: thioredoxin domain-containing protein [Candidatus Contendobacter sp.]|nr:thioredoxin domain-containing protein [Candidatus Contendobacter sp.]
MNESPYAIEVNQHNFAQVVVENSQRVPVLVDFWADWCQPCQILTPLLTKLAQEYRGGFILAKINADAEQALAQHFRVRSLPTVMVVWQGQIVDQIVDVQPESAYRAAIDRFRVDHGDQIREQFDEDLLSHFDRKEDFRQSRESWSLQEKILFCRLARAVHATGLGWWHVNIVNQVRFGRKNVGSERAKGVLGIYYPSTRNITWSRELGMMSKLDREPLTEELVTRIESALASERQTIDKWWGLNIERPGLWPDQLLEDPADSSEETEEEKTPVNKASVPPSNRIYYGPPGTGKTYQLSQMLKRDYDQPAGSGQRYSFVTFHQSYGYEEFIEGLRPLLDGDAESNELRYEIRPGVFKELCRKACLAPDQRFAMVIDEINRGNISKIFGELITLIEPDKREGAENAVTVTLPYSGESFSVPTNVDIIGTMNTADRSLALLDTALRRRFDFVALMPDTRDEPGAPLHGLRVTHGGKVIDIPKMLTAINQRVEALYDRDHTIGHAYFTTLASVLDGEQRFEALEQIFRNRILPLLEEYFFEDWQKIRLVLADNQKEESARFITMTENHEDNLNSLFGNDHGLDAFATKRRYALQESAFSNPDAYIGIYDASALID